MAAAKRASSKKPSKAQKASNARASHAKSAKLAAKRGAKPPIATKIAVAAKAKLIAPAARAKLPAGKPVTPAGKPVTKALAAKQAVAKQIVPPPAKAERPAPAKAAPVKPMPAKQVVAAKPAAPARVAGARPPGSFETKVLTALKRHGGAAVSFGASPDHIKSAFKRCLAEGWTTGTIDSASILPLGEKVLEKLNPEIRAFPAPTLRNRLNDALFRNQGNRPVAPAAPVVAAPEAVDEDDAVEAPDDTVPEVEEDEVVADPDVEKAA